VKTLNPFNAPGSPSAEQQKRRRERLKIGVLAFVAVNIVLFIGLLIQGCQREPAATDTSSTAVPEVGSTDTNGAVAMGQKPDTNAVATPSFESAPTNASAAIESPAGSLTPPPPLATTEYRVAKGDSFHKIAKAKRISEQALASANPGVDRAKLKVGQVLQVPQSTEPEKVAAPQSIASSATVPAATAPATTASVPTKTKHAKSGYTVKSGDTLGRIAKSHGTTVKALKLANGLTSDRIVVGATLKIPSSRKPATSAT
jgi:LysM repeat protein